MKKFLPGLEPYIDENTSVVRADPNSHVGLIVPEIIMAYGDVKTKAKGAKNILPKMFKTVREMKKSYRSVTRNPQLGKTLLSTADLRELKQFARDLGAEDIGFTRVEPTMIFKDKKILFEYAIVLTMEMKKVAIDLAPSTKAQAEIFRTYLGLGVIVNKIADFLRNKGYNAQAGPALGGDVNYSLLAQQAGLGAIGKHGLLITPALGPSLRLAAVYTDIENLPLNETNEHLWISSFCAKCNKCVRSCPAGAIYQDTTVFDDNSQQHIDYKKCAVPFSQQYGCTICVKECVFYNHDYYKIKENFHDKL